MFTNEFLYRCVGALISSGVPLSGKELVYKLRVQQTDIGYCFHHLNLLASMPFVTTLETRTGSVKYQWNSAYKTAGIRYGAGTTGDRHDWYCYTKGGKFYLTIPETLYPLHGDTGIIKITDPMRQTAELAYILRRTSDSIDCVVEQQNGRFFAKPMLTEKYVYSIVVPNITSVKKGDRISVTLREWQTKEHPVCDTVTNNGGIFNNDFRRAILSKYHIQSITSLNIKNTEEFSKGVIDSFADLSSLPWISVNRKDIAYAVKKVNTGYKVAVCIANLPYYLPLGTDADAEFREYGLSCYLRDGLIPVIDLAKNPALDLTSDGKHLGVYISMTLDIHGKITGVEGIECIIGKADYVSASDLNNYFCHQTWAFEEQHSKTMQCLMDFTEVCFLLQSDHNLDSEYSSSYLGPYSDLLWLTDKAVSQTLKLSDYPFIGSKTFLPDDFDITRKDRSKSSLLNTITYETVTKYMPVRPARSMRGYCIRVAEACSRYSDFVNLGLFIRFLRRSLQNDDAEAAWIPVVGKICEEMECVDRRVRSAEREYALRYDNADEKNDLFANNLTCF